MSDDGVDRLMADVTRSIRRKARRRRLFGQRTGGLPWWVLSFLLHVTALLVMAGWTYRLVAEEPYLAPIQIQIIDRPPREEVPVPEPPEPRETVKPDPEVPIDDRPISPERPSKAEPGPLTPSSSGATEGSQPRAQSVKEASASAVFAAEAKARGYHRGIYARRTPEGRARTVGRRGGTTRRAEAAVSAGLLWLANAQEPDGHWSCKRWRGVEDFDVGVTGLALLAFLGAGYTQLNEPYKDTVAKGLQWLRTNQQPNGQFAWRTFYEQGIATMAVSEAYAMTGAPGLAFAAQDGIRYICEVQPEHGGFRYQGAVREADGDMSVTGWQIMALKSGICAGLHVPIEAIERSKLFLKAAYRDGGGSVYLVRDAEPTASMTAVGMLCRQFLGGDEAEIQAAANFLIRHERKVRGPGRGKDRLVGDLYYTYYSTLAMFQLSGERWALWNRLFRDTLLSAQEHDTYNADQVYVRGSWDPAKHQWGNRGGRVYTTAMALLSLEVYYRFLPVYTP